MTARTVAACTMPETGDLAPALTLAAVRARAPVAGRPPKAADAMFATAVDRADRAQVMGGAPGLSLEVAHIRNRYTLLCGCVAFSPTSLGNELCVWVMLIACHGVGHSGTEQGLDGGQQRDCEGRLDEVREGVEGEALWEVRRGEARRYGIRPKVAPDGLDPRVHAQGAVNQEQSCRPSRHGHDLRRQGLGPCRGVELHEGKAGESQGQGGTVHSGDVAAKVHELRGEISTQRT